MLIRHVYIVYTCLYYVYICTYIVYKCIYIYCTYIHILSDYTFVYIQLRNFLTRNTSPIRRTAVRETGVSLQTRVPSLGYLLKPLGPSQHSIVLRGLRGLPMVPREASLRSLLIFAAMHNGRVEKWRIKWRTYVRTYVAYIYIYSYILSGV